MDNRVRLFLRPFGSKRQSRAQTPSGSPSLELCSLATEGTQELRGRNKYSNRKRKEVYHEEAEDCGVGGEGVSSCAHGISDSNRNNQLHGPRTHLAVSKKIPRHHRRGVFLVCVTAETSTIQP